MLLELPKLIKFTSQSHIELSEIPKEYKISSVIIAFTNKHESTALIVHKRNKNLKHHPGQIAFPGGIFDKKDKNLLNTALREWEEEMGENSNYLKIFGRFDSVYTRTNFFISPYLAEYSGKFNFKINQKEVEDYFLLSIQDFLEVPYYFSTLVLNHKLETFHYFVFPQGTLWGASFEIVHRILTKIFGFTRKPVEMDELYFKEQIIKMSGNIFEKRN